MTDGLLAMSCSVPLHGVRQDAPSPHLLVIAAGRYRPNRLGFRIVVIIV
jgi:hypothetical protein